MVQHAETASVATSPIHKGIHKWLWLLLLLVALAPVHLILRPDQSVGDAPLTDDGYYAFTVARHIALGNGITIDGATMTNGFQPLFTLLTVPAFIIAGEDRYAAIRYVLLLNWAIYVGTAYVLGRIASDVASSQHGHSHDHSIDAPTVFWITAFVYLTGTFVFLQHFNGLETGFLLFMYAVTWRYYQTELHSSSLLGLAGLGCLLGLVVLTRIDAVFFVIILSVYLFFSAQGHNLAARMTRFALVSGVAFLVSLPWWFYNLVWFGSLMPTSGRAQQALVLSPERFWEGLLSLVTVAVPVLPFTYISAVSGTIGLVLKIACLLVAMGLILWNHTSIRDAGAAAWRTDSSRRVVEFGVCLFAASLILLIWYALSSHATYFYSRYFAPVLVLSTPVISAIIWAGYTRHPKVSTMFFVALAVPILTLAPLRYLDIFFSGSPHYNQQLPLVREHVPADAYVAAFESGTLGYFRDRVVNLDGKVNPEAQAIREQNGDLLGRYLEERGIRWYCGLVLRETHPFLSGGWEVVEEKQTYGLYYIRTYVYHR